MNGGWRAWLRLFAVQGTWNYERMLGVGMGYAAEPLLEDLKTVDPVRHTEAVVRSAEFFNCNPNLAGLALGATGAGGVRRRSPARRSPGSGRRSAARSARWATSSSGRVWCPLLVGAALIGVVLGASWWAVLGFLVLYNLARVATGVWALRTGLDAGMGVGTAIAQSWISEGDRAGRARRRLRGRARRFPWSRPGTSRTSAGPAAFGALAVAATGVAVTRWFGASLDHGAVHPARARPARALPLGAAVIEREATIVNQEGLHARPAAKIVRLASSFDSEIELFKDGVAVNGKSIMGVMMLAAECGSSIVIRADGPDAEQAVEAITQLVAGGFGEP